MKSWPLLSVHKSLVLFALILICCFTALKGQSSTSYRLEVGKVGTGTGTIHSDPAGITCGANCGAEFPAGSQVRLVAIPEAGSTFIGWGGACQGKLPCMLTVDSNKQVSALFGSTGSTASWFRSYQGKTFDLGIRSLITTRDGGYLGAGLSQDGFDLQVSLFKLDEAGAVVWQQLHEKFFYNNLGFPAVVEVSDGYLVLSSSRENQVFLRKISREGQLIWSRTYQFGEPVLVSSIKKNAGDGCVMVGEGYSTPYYSFVMAVDKNGQPTWLKKYSDKNLKKIEILDDGDLLVGGENINQRLFRVFRLSPAGDVKWAKSYTSDRPGDLHYIGDIDQSPEGDFLLTGTVGSKLICIRLNDGGEPVWTRYYYPAALPFSSPADPVSGLALASGGYLVSGRMRLDENGEQQACVLRLDPTGSVLWQKVYGGPDNLIPQAMEPTDDGGFVLAGVNWQGHDGWVVKADEAGTLSSCSSVFDLDVVAVDTTVSAEDLAVSVTPFSVNTSPFQASTEPSDSTEAAICPRQAPALSVSDARVQEDDRGTVLLGFTVTQSDTNIQTVEVAFHTVEKDAKDGLDYWGASGTVKIPAGAKNENFEVFVMPDTVAENDETFEVVLSNPRNATIDDGTAVGTIVDDDSFSTLSVSKTGTGSGLVSGDQISCGSDCTGAYRKGTQVKLTATADENSVFVGWAGGCSDGQADCTVVIGSQNSVTAEFRRAYPLTVAAASYGVVKSNDGAIDCGRTCQASYNPGSIVTLTAFPIAGARFVGWYGSCTGTGPCQMTMDGAKNVVPRFSPVPFVLQILKQGTGSGRVVSGQVTLGSGNLYSGQTIDCGTGCSAEFYAGQSVPLIVRPDPGSVFKGWSGACTGTASCTVAIDSDKTVTVTFDRPTCAYDLDPKTANVPAAGGPGTVRVKAQTGCDWTAQSLASWIAIVSGGSGLGNGVVNYSVSPNSGPARSGTLAIAGQFYTVQQSAGCSVGLSAVSATAPGDGGSGTISVSASCDWGAASSATWITITNGTRGTGAGNVQYSVLPNPSTTAREGWVWVGGQKFTITQSGSSCPLGVSPTRRIVEPGGGTNTLDIALPAGCSWSVQTQDSWISLTNATGTGSGKVAFTVSPNASVTTRPGKMRVNNTEVEIIQPGINTWFTSGPNGGDITGLVSHPSNPGLVFANGPGGVFKTTDGGVTWRHTTSELAYPQVPHVVISAADPDWLWARGAVGLLRTTDGGANWKVLGPSQVSLFAPHPKQREVVYAASPLGVSKAADGETFAVLPGSPNDVTGLAIDPVDPNRLLVSTRTGVYRTTDGGVTWSAVENGPPRNDKYYYASFVFDAGNHDLVYVSTVDGFWRSADGGRNWSVLQAGMSPGCSGLFATDRLKPGHVYLGGCGLVRRSTDGGLTWEDVGSLPSNLRSAAFLGDSPANGWLAATTDGLRRSVDGVNWEPDGARLLPAAVSNVSIDPFNSRVYASLPGSVWLSDDKATSWVMDASFPAPGPLVFDPSSPATRYLLSLNDIYKTTDAGTTWNPLKSGMNVSALVIDPADRSRLYVLGGGNVYTSDNGGSTWQSAMGSGIAYADVTSICVRPTQPGAVYAGTSLHGVLKSTDGGLSWFNAGWQRFTTYSNPITKIAPHPLNPRTLFVSTMSGFFGSDDDGATWRLLFWTGLTDFAVDPSDPARLWLISNQEVYQTSGGGDWVKLKNGIPTGRVLRKLAIDPRDPSRVYLVTDAGVYTRQTGVECGAQLETTAATVPAAGGSGSFSFVATSACTWLVQSEADWITVTSAATGSGNGQVSYTVRDNSGQARTGRIRVAGQIFTITQESSCNFSLEEPGKQFSPAGGVGTVRVFSGGSSCQWTAETDQPWIYLQEREGSSWGEVEFVVFDNAGPERIGSIKIAGLTYEVRQGSGVAPLTKVWGVWSPSDTWKDVHKGDFNGDGLGDIAGRSHSSGQWWVSLSTGSGFVNESWGSWSTAANWADVNVGDFNGDGRDDIVGRVSSSGEWWVALSTGNSFTNQSWGSWDPAIAWADVRVGDFNHDGLKDVVGRNPADGTLWTGSSDGKAFVTGSCPGWKPGTDWTDVLVAGDHTHTDNLIARWLPTGQLWSGLCYPNPNQILPAGQTWVDLLAADVNGDDFFEVVARGLETAEWWRIPLYPFHNELIGQWPAGFTWAGVRTGDFNGDGRTDIVGRAETTGEIWVALAVAPSVGQTVFGEAKFINLHWDTWRTGVTWTNELTGDFNGDGATDLVARVLETGYWYVRLGTPGGGPLISAVSPNRRPTVSQRTNRTRRGGGSNR